MQLFGRRITEAPGPALGAAVVSLLATLSQGASGQDRIEKAPAVVLAEGPRGIQIDVGGRPFASYRFGDESTTRPFFESIDAPGGTRVTRNHPPVEGEDLTDHPTFHPGLWLAFGDLNGADSWRNTDAVRHDGFVARPEGGPGRGSFAVRNLHEKAGTVIGEEVCRITVLTRPDGTLIVWDSEFRPVGDALVFGDQEEMGLGVRMASPLAVVQGGRITDSEGRRDEAQVWGKQADWCDYRGEVGGKGVGVLLMPDPGNALRCWFHARDYGLLAANPFGRKAFTGGDASRVVVERGESLRLRFGILVYDGDPDRGASYRDFLDTIRPK